MSRIDQIAEALQRRRLPFGDEIACQRIVADVLEGLGLEVAREFTLSGGCGRIDFYLPAERLGLELKVTGSPSDVARQLLRYAGAPEIAALMLLTGRAALGRLPQTLADKPCYVVTTWRAAL